MTDTADGAAGQPTPTAAPADTDPHSTAVEDPAVAAFHAARPRWKRDVALFLTGQTVSLFGSMVVQYAVMWHLTLESKSGVVMALAALFGFLPQAIISIFGGVWADRHNRKLLIMGADAAIAASTLVLAVVMLVGIQDYWIIFLALAVRSTGAGIQTPAVSALIPQIAPPDQLMRINGILGSVQSAMALAAPAAAGAIYGLVSIVAVFFLDVVTAVIGIGLLSLIAVPTLRAAEDRPSYFADLKEGVAYIGSHRLVRWLLVLLAAVFLLAVAPSSLTPLMLVRNFGEEVWKLTVLELCFSVGMVIGGIVLAAWGGLRNRVIMLLASTLIFGALAIALGLSPNLWVFFGFMFLVGLAVPFYSTPVFTMLQEVVEPERQGRVFGFVSIVMAVAMPIGMTVLGPLADVMPIEPLLIGSGVAIFLAVAACFLAPSGRYALAHGKRSEADAAAAEANPSA